MSDDDTSEAGRALGGTDSTLPDTLPDAAERLLGAWRDRLAEDRSAGGVAGDGEMTLVTELAVCLFYPVDATASTSARALQIARSLGERANRVDTVTLHARFAHLRGAVFIDLLERLDPGVHERDGQLIEACLKRADALVGPLAAAALDGCNDSAAADLRSPRDDRAERLVQRLRHDIMTPLQAASLNLELLALERVESEVDVEAIATIQGSIEQVVDMLRPLDDAPREHERGEEQR